MNTHSSLKLLALGLWFAVLAAPSATGCKTAESGGAPAPAASNTGQAMTTTRGSNVADPGTTTTGQATALEPSPIARIVFVGKQEACTCTRNRIDLSWAALQSALDGRTDIAVEQLQSDTERGEVAPFHQMRPIMVLPAIYFLDSSGSLVEMLQGEITPEQVYDIIR